MLYQKRVVRRYSREPSNSPRSQIHGLYLPMNVISRVSKTFDTLLRTVSRVGAFYIYPSWSQKYWFVNKVFKRHVEMSQKLFCAKNKMLKRQAEEMS